VNPDAPPDPAIRHRQALIAERCSMNGKVAYRFDIRVQDEGETVFLDVCSRPG